METVVLLILISIIGVFLFQKILPAKGITHMTTSDLKKLKDKGKYEFVDVRTPSEYKGNHINGFKNIPVHELKQRVHELNKEKEVIVICQSGIRSNTAAKILKKMGFPKVTNVKGGMSSWM
ncbi:rhodanese-like domain-containing protein [Evansella tamaricis]|uniref:Rhodanese-like domain-containing protein n=1 Tax=Evansella tamaricis TaxID=2069301 RepID=A0ABS6JKI6_9BACI|nr:rhodanese-like domain-containing protein [Evansella tamaricis]MBU9714196.1 rhodanese-like domain-containing protein [Evansella tamaricis]